MKSLIKFILIFSLIPNSFANRQQELIVGFAVGGNSDLIARVLVKNKLSSNYVVTNKPGANGQLAIREMQDKKTISIAVLENVFVTNTLIYKEKLVYNTDDIEIIGLVASIPLLLACNKDLGFKNIRDLANYKKDLNFAATSVSGLEEVSSKLLFNKINKNHQIVNYVTGGNKPILDLLGGHVDCWFGTLPTINPFINNDKISLIISTHDISFTGVKVNTWTEEYKEKYPTQLTLGLVVDKSLPLSMKEKLINDFQTEMDSAELRKEMLSKGSIPTGIFGETAKIESTKLLKQHQKILNDLNIK